jgi:putative FmdB family regulatory protein
MPIYEYRCKECGFQKEYMQRMSDAPLTDCPQCRKRSFTKLVSAAGFQLKGTGWYATDFKNNAKPAKPDKPGAKPDKAEAKSDKTEAKPGKPAEPSSKDSSKSEFSCGSGACPACS